jgi:hypothetical protein
MSRTHLIAQYLNPVELRPDGVGTENLFANVEAGGTATRSS